MFGNKNGGASPLGVPLGDLLEMLQPTSLKASLEGNGLTVRHEHYTTRIEVVLPATRESENGPIRAVVRVVAELPKPILTLFQGKEAKATAAYNAFAALGSLCADRGSVYIGSRLTIYEAEDAWHTLHLPLLMFTTICGTEAILGALRRTMTGEGQRGGASKWTERDFEQVDGYLSRTCVCTSGALRLTAEFGLSEDAVSAVAGDHKTALFQLMADQPHPELGGGLLCSLQMPHQLRDEHRLNQVCMQLNKMEMAAHDLPPHFGAWCPGRLGNNPAYITFLPNALHAASGIAVNSAFWAMNRAQWANGMLASLGVGLESEVDDDDAPAVPTVTVYPTGKTPGPNGEREVMIVRPDGSGFVSTVKPNPYRTAHEAPVSARQDAAAPQAQPTVSRSLVQIARSIVGPGLSDQVLAKLISDVEDLWPKQPTPLAGTNDLIETLRRRYRSVLHTEFERLIAELLRLQRLK